MYTIYELYHININFKSNYLSTYYFNRSQALSKGSTRSLILLPEFGQGDVPSMIREYTKAPAKNFKKGYSFFAGQFVFDIGGGFTQAFLLKYFCNPT